MAKPRPPYDREADAERQPVPDSGPGPGNADDEQPAPPSPPGEDAGAGRSPGPAGGGPIDREDLGGREEEGGSNPQSEAEPGAARANAETAGESGAEDEPNPNQDIVFNPHDPSHRGNLRRVLRAAGRNRRAVVLGTAGAAGAAGSLAVLFFVLIPLKIEHIVTNLENRFFATSENALQKESDNMLSDYIKRYVIPTITSCHEHSTISKDCNPAFNNTANPVDAMYKGWSQARVENKLASKYGIEIRFDQRAHKYYMKAPGIKNGKGDDITRFVNPHNHTEFDKNLFQQVSRGQIRAAVDESLGNVISWKPSFFRYKVGRLMEEKYGVKRCLIACERRDALSDKKDRILGGFSERKAAFQIYVVQRVLMPVDAARAIALSCLISPSCDPAATQSTPAQDGSTGELNGEPENPDTDGQLRQQLAQLAGTLGGPIDSALQEYTKMRDAGSFSQYAISYVLEKVGLTDLASHVTNAVPIIGWVQNGAQIISNLANAGPKVKKLSYIIGAAGAVNMFNVYQAYADEIHTGNVNTTEVGSMVSSLSPGDHGLSSDPEVGGTAGAEGSALYGNLVDNNTAGATPTPGAILNDILPAQGYAASRGFPGSKDEKCNNGHGLPTGSLLCPEEKLGGGNSTLTAISSFLHKGFVGIITSIANVINSPPFNLLSAASSAAASFLINLVPGANDLAGIVSKAIAPLFNTLLGHVIPNPYGTNMAGNRVFKLMAAGADVEGNDTAHTILGGKRISAVRAAAVAAAQEDQARQEFSHESFFARMFSTDSQYSLVSTLAMDIPFGVQSSAETSFATLISNPFAALLHGFAAIFTGRAAAASMSGVVQVNGHPQDFAGINQYEPLVPDHPEDYWNQNCTDNASNAYMKDNSWNDAAANYDTSQSNDPSAEPVNTSANPCLTVKNGTGAMGATSNTNTLTTDDLADVNNSSGGSVGGSAPSSGCGGGGKYSALVGPGSSFAGTDQGIDFVPSGSSGFDICAPAAGTITLADQTGHHFNRTSGQAEIIEKLDQPPNAPSSSQYIYFAEIIQLSSTTTVGAHVNKGDVIGHSDQSPGIEVGWAPDATHGFMCTLTGGATPCGQSFDTWVQGL